MSSIIIKNATIYTPKNVIMHGWLQIENGIIIHIDQGDHPPSSMMIDAKGCAVLPGFIDVHVHGARGFHTMQATPEALAAIAQYGAQHGVTSFLAAVMTDTADTMYRALENIAHNVGPMKDGAHLLGAYAEGPYLSLQAKGAHPASSIRRADPREYMKWFAMDVIKQMTIAPEYPENMQLLKSCAAYNIMPCVGHTNASCEDIEMAIAHGARQATHTFNAMSGMHHRAPGAAGSVLTNDAIVCELIADGVHVHPAMLKLAVRAKGIDKIVLVTDAERGAGMKPGSYDRVNVTECGVYLPDGTLAGSVLTMNNALKNIIDATGLSLDLAWPMTSLNPARQLGLDHKKGKLVPGYDADIVVLDPHDYAVMMTMVGGEMVYEKISGMNA